MKNITKKTRAYFGKKTDEGIQKIESTPTRSYAISTLVILSSSVGNLGYFHFQRKINEPMMDRKLAEEKAALAKEYTDKFDLFEYIKNSYKPTEPVAQGSSDSDGDGIPDIDEAQFGTSPYLADTDSDGVNDQQELLGGTDPKCAEGKVCEDA